jgi:hypothetical protein
MENKLTVNDVIKFIWSPAFASTDRQRIIHVLNEQRKLAATQASCQFVRGMRVEFNAKYGDLVTGTIMKVNRMTIFVKAADGSQWRVSPQLLRKTA